MNLKFYYNNTPCSMQEAFHHWLSAAELQGRAPTQAALIWRLALLPDQAANAEPRELLAKVFITIGDHTIILPSGTRFVSGDESKVSDAVLIQNTKNTEFTSAPQAASSGEKA